jgi:hypothetical protein
MNLGRFRLSISTELFPDKVQQALDTPPERRAPGQRSDLAASQSPRR